MQPETSDVNSAPQSYRSFGSAATIFRQHRVQKNNSYASEYGFNGLSSTTQEVHEPASRGLSAFLKREPSSSGVESIWSSNRGLSSSVGVSNSNSRSSSSHQAQVLTRTNIDNVTLDLTLRTARSASKMSRQVLFVCLQRCVLEGTVLGRYFGAWRRHWQAKERRALQQASLRLIARRSVANLLRRCFDRFRRHVVHKRAVTSLPKIAATASMALGYQTLLTWRYFLHLRTTERRTMPHLEKITQLTKVGLAKQTLDTWKRFSMTKQQRAHALRTLEALTSIRSVRFYFQLWKRRRHMTNNAALVARVGRRSLREYARKCLNNWILYSIRRQLARRCEQFHFALIARRYFISWGALVQKNLTVRTLEQRCCQLSVADKFAKWHLWLHRKIVAEKEYQRCLVLVLRRYFLKWRRAHTLKSLSYNTYMARKRGERSVSAPIAESLNY